MRTTGTAVLSVLMLALAAVMLLPAALGYHRYVIVSGSMSGTYDRGAIVYAKPVPVTALRVGDTITYAPPAGAQTSHRLVTHRIVSIGHDRAGAPVFRTRGDANRHPDPWRFTLDRPTQDRVAFALPYAGYAFAALSVPWVRMLLVGLPALLVALSILRGVWRRAGEEAACRQGSLAAGA